MSRGQGKQAKLLTPLQVTQALAYVGSIGRNHLRDKVIILLSVKAGLRAIEIASLTWNMVLGSDGRIGDFISLTNTASKGKTGGRDIPINHELARGLKALLHEFEHRLGISPAPDATVIQSERGAGFSPETLHVWFHNVFKACGIKGSSHSGRRTFITKLASQIIQEGGTIRDVQQLAGHASLNTTQRYIEGSTPAKRAAVEKV